MSFYAKYPVSGGGGGGDFKADGSIPMTGNLDAGGNRLINVANPIAPQDASTKNYVDTTSANTALSNLTSPTAVNQTLSPYVDIGASLGDPATRWYSVSANVITAGDIIGSAASKLGYSTAPSSEFDNVLLPVDASGYVTTVGGDLVICPQLSSSATHNAGLYLSTPGVGGGGAGYDGGPIVISTSNCLTGATPGIIQLTTGASASGTRSKILLDALAIDVNSTQIINLATPTLATDAANKAYVDASAGANKTLSNLTSPTAITAALLPATTGVTDIGSLALLFNAVYANNLIANNFVASNGYISAGSNISAAAYISAGSYLSAANYLNVGLGSPSADIPAADKVIEVLGTHGALVIGTNATNGFATQRFMGLTPAKLFDITYQDSDGALVLTPLNQTAGTLKISGSILQLTSMSLNMTGSLINNVLNPVSNQDAATKLYVDTAVAAGSSGANTALSNLTATSINQTLKPAVAYGVDIGVPNKPFGGVWSNYLGFISNIGTTPTAFSFLETAQAYTTPSGATGFGNYWHTITDKNYGISLFTEASNLSNTGKLIFETGNAGATGFNSGDINLRTGSAANIRGKITLDAVLNLPVRSAPTTPVDGDLWFDGTNLKFRVGGITRTVTII